MPTTKKITDFLEAETGGKSYKAHKYSLDADDRPSVGFGVGEAGNVWKKYGETTVHKKYVNLEALSKKLAVSGDQLLTYFLDGSRRVYKVDHMGYAASGTGNRSEIYPIIAGQIGVGCCRRVDRQLERMKFIREIVISVPDIADADGRKGGFFPALAKKLTDYCADLKKLNIEVAAVLDYRTSGIKTDDDYENRAIATVQDRMIEREKALVAQLAKDGVLNQDNYLIKDGSLEYRPTTEVKKDSRLLAAFRNNYAYVIGASKSFNPAVCKDLSGKENPGFIADLGLYERTPVSRFSNEGLFGNIEFAVWYIRLRHQSKTRTPFDGILKIEKMLVTSEEQEKGIDSDIVDMLSAYIINERNPVCYGSDLRWANHIYPMYLTESFVKSQYIATESFLQLF